jgi:hypothetical protein
VRSGAETEDAFEVVQEEKTIESADPAFNQRFPSLARAPRQPAEKVPAGAPGNGHGTLTPAAPPSDEQPIRVFPYGIARTRLERAIREKRVPVYVTNDISEADAVMAIRSTYQSRPKKLRDVAGRPVNTIVVRSNTFSQIAAGLEDILRQKGQRDDIESKAIEELQAGVETVLQSGKPFELSPQPAHVRKVQHQMAEARRVASEGVGEEPNRRLRLLPTRA